MSATWSFEDMNLIWSCFWSTLSLTKWKPTSICLVGAWSPGLEDRYVAPILSHLRIGIYSSERPNSLRRDCTQIISDVASDSVLEHDTVACLRAFQRSNYHHKRWHIPLGSPVIKIPSPINISERGQKSIKSGPKCQAIRHSKLNKPKNALDGCPMRISRSIQVLTNLVDNKGDICLSKSEILEPSNNIAVTSSIISRE